MAISDRTSRQLLWAGLAGLGAFLLTRRLSTSTPFSFANRTVLLTGGSRGLGLVLARRLAAEGARLALVARDPQELARARQELAATGAIVSVYPADLTDEAARERLVARVEAELGAIDVLLHDAGIIQGAPLENLSARDYREAMAIHFEAPLHLMRLLVPGMRRRGLGKVINIASIGGKVAIPHLAAYSASKFALVGLGEAWAAELAGTGVTVTTVCPGLMRTGGARHAQVKGQAPREYQIFKTLSSLPVLTMKAEEAADQIIEAGRRGDPVAVVGWPARLLTVLHGLAPSATVRLLSLANRLLPPGTPAGEQSPLRRGAELESPATTNIVTALTDRAARRNNEMES